METWSTEYVFINTVPEARLKMQTETNNEKITSWCSLHLLLFYSSFIKSMFVMHIFCIFVSQPRWGFTFHPFKPCCLSSLWWNCYFFYISPQNNRKDSFKLNAPCVTEWTSLQSGLSTILSWNSCFNLEPVQMESNKNPALRERVRISAHESQTVRKQFTVASQKTILQKSFSAEFSTPHMAQIDPLFLNLVA